MIDTLWSIILFCVVIFFLLVCFGIDIVTPTFLCVFMIFFILYCQALYLYLKYASCR